MDSYIRVRLTSEDKKGWQKEARDSGVSMSEYIRQRVSGVHTTEIREKPVHKKSVVVEIKKNEGLKSLIETGLVSKGVRGKKELPSQQVGELKTYFKK